MLVLDEPVLPDSCGGGDVIVPSVLVDAPADGSVDGAEVLGAAGMA
jgi:hypothetical protein